MAGFNILPLNKSINGVQYGFGGSCTASGSPTSGSGYVIVELIYWG